MSDPFRIIYDKSRFPIQQMRADGKLGCRGCGSAIPKGRQTWCSNKCFDTYEPKRVMYFVRDRDKEICVLCGYDHNKEYDDWLKTRPNGQNWDVHQAWSRTKPRSPEYDHIVPFSEGGLTILENMRTLCRKCHKKRTRDWRRAKANASDATTGTLNLA